MFFIDVFFSVPKKIMKSIFFLDYIYTYIYNIFKILLFYWVSYYPKIDFCHSYFLPTHQDYCFREFLTSNFRLVSVAGLDIWDSLFSDESHLHKLCMHHLENITITLI